MVTPPAQDSDVSRAGGQTRSDGGAAEAEAEFSRFDQGPLADQPAFAPDDDEDDATPPPIARHPIRQASPAAPETPKEELSQSASPGVQDRWAQIRKNAAQRAAVRPKDDTTRGSPTRTGDGDDDTSGEESECFEVAEAEGAFANNATAIESRVARIKARVAELTGNMEDSSAPHGAQNRR